MDIYHIVLIIEIVISSPFVIPAVMLVCYNIKYLFDKKQYPPTGLSLLP